MRNIEDYAVANVSQVPHKSSDINKLNHLRNLNKN